MPRQPDILRPTKLEVSFPEDLRARIDLLLWSDSEQRVPKGAYKRFFMRLLQVYFDGVELDLGDYSGITPKGAYVIRSSKQNIEQLKLLLSGK